MIVKWNIGGNTQNMDRIFNDYMDEVKIFGKSLKQEEVLSHMFNIKM